jgi:hypothetical protein
MTGKKDQHCVFAISLDKHTVDGSLRCRLGLINQNLSLINAYVMTRKQGFERPNVAVRSFKFPQFRMFVISVGDQ